MTIGTRIAYLRKKQNLTQAELAALLFVSPKTVSKWENGYGLPDVKILPELSKTLCVDIDYLLTGIYPKQPQKQPPPVQEKIEYVEPEKGEYRLSLYQVTHNHLTKWVLFFNILVLVFSLIGGPIDVLNEQGDRFTTYTILAAIYPLLSVFGEANGWENGCQHIVVGDVAIHRRYHRRNDPRDAQRDQRILRRHIRRSIRRSVFDLYPVFYRELADEFICGRDRHAPEYDFLIAA